MKKLALIGILTFALLPQAKAEEVPIASPSENDNGSSHFQELFKTPLTETDFFVCESNIHVSISKKEGNAETKEDIFYFRVNKRGKNGDLTFKELKRSLEDSKLKAINKCKTENSEKECITHGLINNQSKYNEFDYATKKTFLEALTKSCSESKATCNSATASTPECFIINLEPPQTTNAETAPSPTTPAKAPAKK